MAEDVREISKDRDVLIIGDSFVAGEGAEDGAGWAQTIASLMNADIVGVCGATSRDILNHLPNKAYARVIVQIGTNDARFRHAQNATETSVSEYRENLATLVALCQEKSATVEMVFVDLLFVDETRTVLFKPDRSYFDASLERMAGALQAFCAAKSHKMVSLQAISRCADLLSDGLHPNSLCHQDIASRVIAAT